MVKGAAYNLDLLVLGVINSVLSLFGLPWMCAATVQSLNHVRAMADIEYIERGQLGKEEVIKQVAETRLTGFTIHALILGSLGLLSTLRCIPMPVVAGIFLYLGRKVMSGNEFLGRIKLLVSDKKQLPEDSVVNRLGAKTVARYVSVQVSMLALLWTLKSIKRTALFFPSVIGMLIMVRMFVLPKHFSESELKQLDKAVG